MSMMSPLTFAAAAAPAVTLIAWTILQLGWRYMVGLLAAHAAAANGVLGGALHRGLGVHGRRLPGGDQATAFFVRHVHDLALELHAPEACAVCGQSDAHCD